MAETTKTRQEKDSIGVKEVPIDAYYGIQTIRAAENFTITGLRTHPEIIRSAVKVKKAAAITNLEAGKLEKKIADAMVAACDEILAGKLLDQFITDPIQGGAGTSLNMNVNEVISNRAIEILGGTKGDYKLVNPNDHANYGQSTNDVVPASGRITIMVLLDKAIIELKRLHEAFSAKAKEFDPVIKMGRTHLQDAVPIRLGQEFKAFAAAIKRDINRFEEAKKTMRAVNMGGTAVGTCLNADPVYLKKIAGNLSKVTGFDIVLADDIVDGTCNLDEFAYVSGVIKACAVSLLKICGDLRIMSSGPRCGLQEINLPPMQPGSSIMPGKVNPVIPEVVCQVALNIIGNDTTVALAASSGQLQLNVFEPVLFYNLFENIDTLASAVKTLVDNCVVGISANAEKCKQHVENSVGIITAINPYVGYTKASELAKEAISTGTPVRELILRDKLLTPEQLDKILDPFAMTEPAK